MDTIFGPGFQIQSKDSEFSLAFHDLTQVEGRFLGTEGPGAGQQHVPDQPPVVHVLRPALQT